MLSSKGGVAPLLQWIKTLEMESAERQNALEAAKERNNAIRCDNANLKVAIKKLSPTIQQIGSKREELNKLSTEFEESSKRRESLQSRLTEFKKQNSHLHDELESRVGEMSSLERSRQADREQIRTVTGCVNTLEHQIELGQICLQQKKDDIKWRDAAIKELKSAVHEHTEILNVLDERKSQLKAEIGRLREETQTAVGKRLSIMDEIRMCTADLDRDQEKTLPVFWKSVPNGTLRPTYWRMAAVLSWISFAVGFATMLFLMLMLMGTAMCRPAPEVPCQDLLRDVLPAMLLPHCDLNFPLTPPF
ncbi:hypothetical protein ACEWY4_022932 [Coilia grayii]|uniref:Uncharacterized protein n=1 Tax=Coilia grayii TaxID=363190 RepID=A0ABD1J1K3_9TELE